MAKHLSIPTAQAFPLGFKLTWRRRPRWGAFPAKREEQADGRLWQKQASGFEVRWVSGESELFSISSRVILDTSLNLSEPQFLISKGCSDDKM